MLLLILSALVALTAAQPPVWWAGGQCGASKFADAGDGCAVSGSACTRVIGGISARENEFPYVAYIKMTSDGTILCAASIINERFVLTSARCTNPLGPDDLEVVIGAHNRTGTPSASEQTFAVSGVFEHEDYDQGVRTNDVSLIQLATAITIDENTTPICPPDPASGDYTASRVEFAGWGATVNDGSNSNNLMYTSMAVFQPSYCITQWAAWFTIEDQHVCASDTGSHDGRDKCSGDGGGAIAFKNANGFFEAVGLTCFGSADCADGKPGVYTRVSTHSDWITTKLEKNP